MLLHKMICLWEERMGAEANIEPETIRAIMLTGFGGYDKIQIQQVPKPQPKKDSVLIEIKACGINFSDIYVRQGIFTFHGIKPPFILGTEGAGIVSAIGEDVTEFKVGDRVLCWNFEYGMWAEYVTVPQSHCYPIPNKMNYLQANGIICNYITAYLALLELGNLRSGQSVLIQAAAGGVGWAATQIAKSLGNVKIFGTASASKHELIKENGVTYPIDYHKNDFVEEILCISSSGVNVILDCLSGFDFMRSQKCLKHLGHIIHIGISNMINGEKRSFLNNLKTWWQVKNISVIDLVLKNKAVCGLSINELFEKDPIAFKEALEKVMCLFNEEKIKPRIDSIWSFEEVIEATKWMTERKNIGKMILVPKKDDNAEQVELYQN